MKGWRRSHRCISGGRGDTAQGTKTRWLGGPPAPPTHAHTATAMGPGQPLPHGRHTGKGCGEGTRFWSFNTCRIKFVSVQSVVGKGPSMLRGKFLPAGSGSSPVASLAAAPGDPRPWGWAHMSWLVVSRGCVHPIAGLGGSRVPSQGCTGAGPGQGWPGHIHGVGSEPGSFHTVQPQQAQALPGVRALRRGCLQGDLQARETAESRTGGPRASGRQVLLLSRSPRTHTGLSQPCTGAGRC